MDLEAKREIERIQQRILTFSGQFIYPPSLTRMLQEPIHYVNAALKGLVLAGDLETWEIPQHRSRIMEEEAKRGTGNSFKGLVDDDFFEIEFYDIVVITAYRKSGT